MKKALLTTALIAATAMGVTSATAQGIAPVSTVPTTDVTVGTMGIDQAALIAAGAAAIIIIAAMHSSDGTN